MTFSYNIYVSLHIESSQKGVIRGKNKNLIAQSQNFKKIQPDKRRFKGIFWPKNVKPIKLTKFR